MLGGEEDENWGTYRVYGRRCGARWIRSYAEPRYGSAVREAVVAVVKMPRTQQRDVSDCDLRMPSLIAGGGVGMGDVDSLASPMSDGRYNMFPWRNMPADG